MQLKSPTSRLLRWKFELAGYNFKIIHIKGKENLVADCLSRFIENPNLKAINMLTRAQARQQNIDETYITPDQNRERMKTNKTIPVEENKLPTIIESTDLNLAKNFPVQLVISNINNHVLLSKENIENKLIKPWNIISIKNHSVLIILTDGLIIDKKKFETSLNKLLTLCNKFNITKVVFKHNSFVGSTTEYNTVKKSIHNLFTKTNIHFLFLNDKIITNHGIGHPKKSNRFYMIFMTHLWEATRGFIEWLIKLDPNINGWDYGKTYKTMYAIVILAR